MRRDGRWWMVAMTFAALVSTTATPARAAGTIVLPRPGQVGLGIQGGFGTLLKSGELGGTFGNGPTVAVRLRYRMRYERALGLSFEGQRFDIRVPEAHDPVDTTLSARINLKVILSGIEFYQLFGTRTRATKMLMVGAGLAQTSGRTIDKETWYRQAGSDGAYVSLGGGVERFLIRSWALDLSARYTAVFLPDARSHDVQAALGFIFYASY
jgi:hypothetical protein